MQMPQRYGNSRAIWDHTVLPATQQSDIPAFTAAQAGTRFSEPVGMQGWVDMVGEGNKQVINTNEKSIPTILLHKSEVSKVILTIPQYGNLIHIAMS